MKAIWKRIGLLFTALLLACLFITGCNSGSSSDDEGDSGGSTGSNVGDTIHNGGISRDVVEMRVVTMPANASYEGLPVDLRGIRVELRHSDRSVTIETDHTKFFTQTKNGPKNISAAGNASAGIGNVTDDRYITQWSYINGTTEVRGEVPNDYSFAEWRRLEYWLCYRSPNTNEIIKCDLIIPGVLDIEEVMLHKKEIEGWSYYIDDQIDWFNKVQVDLTYNTAHGWFYQNGKEGPGDRQGTNFTLTYPIHPNWEWSLNYARSGGQKPYIRINVGNVRVSPVYNSVYTSNRYTDIRLANLYTVSELKWLVPPNLGNPNEGGQNKWYSDMWPNYPNTWKEQWFQMALQNAVIEVNYVNQDGEPAPEKKRMVANPNSDKELSLFSHMVRWPMVQGPRELIYKNQRFVFAHENSEKYGDANIQSNYVQYLWSEPAKVYIFDPNYDFTVTPTVLEWVGLTLGADGGSYQKLMEKITITGQFTYYNEAGTEVETVSREINKNAGNLYFQDVPSRGASGIHRSGGLVDNALETKGEISGIYSGAYWNRFFEGLTENLVYVDWWNDFIPYPYNPTLTEPGGIDGKVDERLKKWVYDSWDYGMQSQIRANGRDGWRVARTADPIELTLTNPNAED